MKCLPPHLLKEVLDLQGIPAYDYTKVDTDTYNFTTTDGMNVDVIFMKFSDYGVNPETDVTDPTGFFVSGLSLTKNPTELYNVGYTVNGKASQNTGKSYRDLMYILKTVIAIIYEFIDEYHPYGLFITASSKEIEGVPGDRQKDAVYRMLMDYHGPVGYKRDNDVTIKQDSKQYEGFMVYKRLTRKEK